MGIKIADRYKLLNEYVKNRRGQEELMKKSKDPLIKAIYPIRSAGTTLVALWKEVVIKQRMRFRQAIGLE